MLSVWMPPRIPAVMTMSVTYHPASSRVSINVWYLSFFPLGCGGGVAILAKGKFDEL